MEYHRATIQAVGKWVPVSDFLPEQNRLVLCYSCEDDTARVQLGKYKGDHWDLGSHTRPVSGKGMVTWWAAFNPPPPFQMGYEGRGSETDTSSENSDKEDV